MKISRLETGTFQLSPCEHDINDTIISATEQIAPKAESRQIQIFYTPERCITKFDSKWTREALFNILDNAIKYSPKNSVVTVSVSVFEMFACICVADQGIGIPEEDLPRIFGRFYRGQNVREQGGVGIGLYLSRQIIEGQGGYITVESKLGRTSVFKIFLPV